MKPNFILINYKNIDDILGDCKVFIYDNKIIVGTLYFEDKDDDPYYYIWEPSEFTCIEDDSKLIGYFDVNIIEGDL